MKIFLFSFILLLFAPIGGFANDLTGTVKSTSGKPLANVFIFGRSLNEVEETDAKGFFKFHTTAKVIAFRCIGFRPLTKILDESTRNLDIVVEACKATDWDIADCLANDSEKRIGFSIRLPIPQGSSSQEGADYDYSYFSINAGFTEKQAWLHGMSGPMASMGIPPEEWISDSVQFTERSYNSHLGADIRGQTKDGLYWRYVGRYGEFLPYGPISKEAAAFFDKIIDRSCRKMH